VKTDHIHTRIKSTLAAMAFIAAPLAVRAETRAENDARMKWFDEARFGMFIHWIGAPGLGHPAGCRQSAGNLRQGGGMDGPAPGIPGRHHRTRGGPEVRQST
jgi:hypothetical protein